MKKFLLLFSLIITSLSLSAQDSFNFTYANGSIFTYGKGKKETLDVAMKIADPGLAGMKLTGIQAYIATSEGIESPKAWLSNSLNLESGQNAPDIATYEATLSNVELEGNPYALLEVKLSTPYTLTANPVYVGYSINVAENSSDAQKMPLVLCEGANDNGFFFHASKSVLKWMEYSETAGGVAYIVANLEGNIPENSLALVGNETIFADNNKAFNATFFAENVGLNSIKSLTYSYSFDNGNSQTKTAELASPVSPNYTGTSPLTLQFEGVEGTGPHSLKVEITEVNGVSNEAVNPVYTSVVNVVPFRPVHRPLVEEMTGLWCQWCPRGYLAMEMLAEDYQNQAVLIAYHYGLPSYPDPMEVTTQFPVEGEFGLPSSTIDRDGVVDPYYGKVLGSEFGIAADMMAVADKLAIASIDLSTSLEADMVNVEAQAKFILDIEEADYEIGYVLIGNDLSDPDWIQANGYAGASGYEGTPLEVLTTWPRNVEGLVFNDVAINADAFKGVEGSLPASITHKVAYTDTYSFDISGNSLVQNRENIEVAAFIIDKSTGLIVNANRCKINSTAIKGIEAAKEIVSEEYFDLTGHRLSHPGQGIVIKIEKYSDGSSKARKIRSLR